MFVTWDFFVKLYPTHHATPSIASYLYTVASKNFKLDNNQLYANKYIELMPAFLYFQLTLHGMISALLNYLVVLELTSWYIFFIQFLVT